jgi:hypothetical protein
VRFRPFACLMICAAVAAAQERKSFSFETFSSPEGLQLRQDASVAGSVLRLTPANQNAVGAAWFSQRVPVRSGFATTFRFQLTEQGGLGRGADGLALVLQNVGTDAIGGRGGSGGFGLGGRGHDQEQAIPQSIAVFFDTFKNAEDGDPSDNSLSISTNGPIGSLRWPPPRLGRVAKLKPVLKDGAVHVARVVYEPPVISVFLDDLSKPVLRAAVDLGTIIDESGSAYIGFTAATGAGWENHDVLSWSFDPTLRESVDSSIEFSKIEDISSNVRFEKAACLPERNLCTPEKASVEAIGPGRFHVILPAHLEWGASVPNASGRAVEIGNARGNVCWDLQGLGPMGCNGPEGDGLRAGAGFVAPNDQAGALIQRTVNGQTSFSVNGRMRNVFRNQSGAAEFREHEGFFEFDVEVR